MRRAQCQCAVEKRGEPPNTCKTLVERVGWLLEYEELRGINKGGDSTELQGTLCGALTLA